MTTSLKWKSVVWCVNSIRKYFVWYYTEEAAQEFSGTVYVPEDVEKIHSLIYVMQQAAINLSLYAHKFERQRCLKFLAVFP